MQECVLANTLEKQCVASRTSATVLDWLSIKQLDASLDGTGRRALTYSERGLLLEVMQLRRRWHFDPEDRSGFTPWSLLWFTRLLQMPEM